MRIRKGSVISSLCADLNVMPGTKTCEIGEGPVAEIDTAGSIVGLDIDGASTKLNLSKVETIALRLSRTVA